MTLLEMVLKEYIAIVELLEEINEVENDRIIMEKDEFKRVLERFSYLSFREKTKIYKDLNFIIHDKKSYTMPYKDPFLKKTVRMVVINYRTFKTVQHLYSKNIE